MPQLSRSVDRFVDRVALDFSGEKSRTKQSFSAECDINNIMSKYMKTGLVSHVSRYGGDYSDVAVVSDYHTSMNNVVKAQSMFMSLPSFVRARFGNDPGAFLDAVGDPKMHDELVKLGVFKGKPAPAPASAPAPAPAPAPAAAPSA